MINMTFTPEMLDVLGDMKGKTFKSYECDLDNKWHRTAGAFRINLGRYAVDVTCVNHPVEDWDVEEDDPTVFACALRGLNDPFFPETSVPTQAYMVNEVITGIEVARDVVSVDKTPVAKIDTALIIRTKYSVYTFARGIWFDYTIDVNVSDKAVIPYSPEECADDWSDEDESKAGVATVVRSVLSI